MVHMPGQIAVERGARGEQPAKKVMVPGAKQLVVSLTEQGSYTSSNSVRELLDHFTDSVGGREITGGELAASWFGSISQTVRQPSAMEYEILGMLFDSVAGAVVQDADVVEDAKASMEQEMQRLRQNNYRQTP